MMKALNTQLHSQARRKAGRAWQLPRHHRFTSKLLNEIPAQNDHETFERILLRSSLVQHLYAPPIILWRLTNYGYGILWRDKIKFNLSRH